MTMWNSGLLAMSLASPLPVIESPRVPPLEDRFPLVHCLQRVFVEQAPPNLLADNNVMLSGPAIRQDAAPRGAVAEIVFVARKNRAWPTPGTYITMSFWLETPDSSLWEQGRDGAFRASGFLNPGKVFDRVLFQHVFDLDVSACDPLFR